MYAGLSIPSSQLAGTFGEAILYGIYLVTCVFCAQTLLLTEGRWVRLHEVRRLMLCIAIVFFLVSTLDIAIEILQIFRAFIEADDPTVEFNKIKNWVNITQTLNRSFNLLLGDFVLIYRCWIVYGQRWAIIAPSLFLYLGVIVTTIKLLEIQISSQTIDEFNTAIRPWFTTMFGASAMQTILSTSMLVWRIWRVEKQVGDKHNNYPTGFSERRRRPLHNVMRVIAESGIVYTMLMLVTFVLSALGGDACEVGAKMALQMAGIVFNVILVRTIQSSSREHPIEAAKIESGHSNLMFLHTAGDTSILSGCE